MTDVHVVVDALSVHHGGGATYLRSQLEALARVAPRLRLKVIAAPESVALLPADLDAVVELHRLGTVRRALWEQTVLAARQAPRGVLYNPGGTTPLGPHRLPSVVALQNPNFFGPGVLAPHNRRWYRRARAAVMRASARRADRCIAVSASFAEAVAADIPSLRSRLVTLPSGAPGLPAERRRPPGLWELEGGFVLSLSNDAPHKQLDLVVRAWVTAAAASAHPSTAPALVMAGRRSPRRRDELAELVPPLLRARLVQLGQVDDRAEVAWLLDGATALVTASTLESFGFTTAEAGSVGCPVIASDIPAHREVAGGRAAFVPPGDEAALAAAMHDAACASPPPRTPWHWPVSWDEHAAHLAEVLTDVADGRAARSGPSTDAAHS